MLQKINRMAIVVCDWFQWAPTLGGECYYTADGEWLFTAVEFQWAPTLGGECYERRRLARPILPRQFQWAPTLGGECYDRNAPPAFSLC